jgi:hypothetical protein
VIGFCEKESGINGPNGWTVNNYALQNNYYTVLMNGISSSTADASTVVPNALNWTRFYQNNAGTGLPDRNYWTLNTSGRSIIMVSGSKVKYTPPSLKSKQSSHHLCSLSNPARRGHRVGS